MYIIYMIMSWYVLFIGYGYYRINFTLEHLAPVSPPHQHFIQQLTRDHQSDSGHRIRFTANQIPVHNITQCFHYNRNDQMVRKESIIYSEVYLILFVIRNCGSYK